MDEDNAKDVSGIVAGAHVGIGLQPKGLSVLSIDSSIASITVEHAIKDPPFGVMLHLMRLQGSHFRHLFK